MPRDLATLFRAPIKDATVLVGDDPITNTKNIFVVFRDGGESRVLAWTTPNDGSLVALLDDAQARELIAHLCRPQNAGGAEELCAALERELDARRAH